jgi:signal transduction histidine kinase/CheY-like chemotaxis protein
MSTQSWAALLLEAAPGLVVVLDAQCQVVAANPVAKRRIAAARPQPGTLVEVLRALGVGPEDILTHVHDAVERTGSWRGRLGRAGARSSEDPPSLYEASLRRGPDGAVAIIVGDRRDVLARAQAERDRAATEEYLARLGHELRTPLNAVLGFAQLLELDPLARDEHEAIARILTAGRHMAALLDEVLDLSRIRGGGIDLDVGPVPVLDVVRGVLDLAEPLAFPRDIQRRIEPAQPLVALADRTRLWQVVLNLVSNAVKYGKQGGEVRVGVHAEGGRVVIEVADDGPGLPPESVNRLFRPFERLGAERSGVEGTGLGLALSHAVVTAMGGTLSLAGSSPAGTTMRVELDAAPGVRPEGGESRSTVVHVSGDPASHALIAQLLRSRLRTEAIPVTSAAAAPEAVRGSRPSLVLVDDALPDGDATELLGQLAGQPETALIPVVVLAQDAEDRRVAVRLRAAGAAAVLDLPLDLRELLDVVGRFLDRPPAT